MDCMLLKVAVVWMIRWIKNHPTMCAPKQIGWCTVDVVRCGQMTTGFCVEMVVWRPVRWRRGYSDQMMELTCWCISPMAVVHSLFRDGGDVAGGYYTGLQASEITRDLYFVAQDSVETLRHRFSWRLWQSSTAIFESGYTMQLRGRYKTIRFKRRWGWSFSLLSVDWSKWEACA